MVALKLPLRRTSASRKQSMSTSGRTVAEEKLLADVRRPTIRRNASRSVLAWPDSARTAPPGANTALLGHPARITRRAAHPLLRAHRSGIIASKPCNSCCPLRRLCRLQCRHKAGKEPFSINRIESQGRRKLPASFRREIHSPQGSQCQHPAAVRMVQESPLADLNGPTSKTANASDGAVHGNQVGAGRVPCALRQALANTCRWKLARQQLAPELKVAATTFASNFLLAFNIRAGIGALLRVLQLLRTRYVQWHLGSVLLRSQWL